MSFFTYRIEKGIIMSTTDVSNPRLKFYEIIKTFKEQITTLINDNSLQISDADRQRFTRKFNNIYEKLMIAKAANSKLAIELFHSTLFVPYGQEIINQNDEFFLKNRNELFGEEVNNMGLGDLVEGISNIWPQLDSGNKRTIWRYILALCKVADLSVGGNHFEVLKAQVSGK